jgi:hypothetical protein
LAKSRSADGIGHLIPDILPLDEARFRLLQLLSSGFLDRADFVLRGLAILRERGVSFYPDDVALAIEAVVSAPTSLMLDVSAFEALIEAFGDDARVRQRATESLSSVDAPLGTIARRYTDVPAVRSALVQALTPLPTTLRLSLVETLGNVREDFILTTLRRHVIERDDEVRTLASITYHRKILGDRAAEAEAVQRLIIEVDATGPYFEEHRRSALAGLILLKRLDAIPGNDPGKDSALKWIVGLGGFRRPNGPLVQLVAEHWDYVRASFRDAISARLESGGSPPVWDALAGAVGDFPSLTADIELALMRTEEDRLSSSLLRFIARKHARTPYLRDLCIRLLWKSSADYGHDVELVAGEILASDFGGDPLALGDILSGGPISLRHDGVIRSLTLGWPDAPKVAELYAALNEANRPLVSWLTHVALTAAACPAEEFAARAAEQLLGVPEFIIPDLKLSVINRLRWDEEARRHVRSALTREGATSHERASFPRALREAGFLDRTVAAWCEGERARQEAMTSPELGVDVVDSSLRPVQFAMLDALG